MKRLLPILLLLPLLGGCSKNLVLVNAGEIEDFEIVQTVGVDLVDGELLLTAAVGAGVGSAAFLPRLQGANSISPSSPRARSSSPAAIRMYRIFFVFFRRPMVPPPACLFGLIISPPADYVNRIGPANPF